MSSFRPTVSQHLSIFFICILSIFYVSCYLKPNEIHPGDQTGNKQTWSVCVSPCSQTCSSFPRLPLALSDLGVENTLEDSISVNALTNSQRNFLLNSWLVGWLVSFYFNLSDMVNA